MIFLIIIYYYYILIHKTLDLTEGVIFFSHDCASIVPLKDNAAPSLFFLFMCSLSLCK